VVHSIFLPWLLGLTIFFCNLTVSSLWPASRPYTFRFKSMHLHFAPNHSHPFLKYHLVRAEPPFTVKTINWLHQTGLGKRA